MIRAFTGTSRCDKAGEVGAAPAGMALGGATGITLHCAPCKPRMKPMGLVEAASA